LTISFSCIIIHLPSRYTLFPYTTLFRSQEKLAHEEFQPIVAGAKISPDNLLDAAYAAQRLSFNTFASTLFSQAVDASDDDQIELDRKSTRLNSSHVKISYAVFCLKKKNI